MSDTSVIPASLTVRNLFEDLLGRDCNVAPGDPMTADDLKLATVAIYTDSAQQIHGVLGMTLPLAVQQRVKIAAEQRAVGAGEREGLVIRSPLVEVSGWV